MLSRRQVIAAATAPLAGRVMAQQSTSGVITLVVPFPAGGAADALARSMQPLLQRLLGETVIVDNISGVSGILGVQRLLAGPADGRRILLGSPSETIVSPLANRNAQFTSEDLRMVGAFAQNYMALVTRSGLPVANVNELIQLAKTRSGDKALSYASIGYGSLFHIAAEDFQRQASISMLHVPYKGMAPLIADVAGNVVDASFVPVGGPLADLARGRRLKILGVTSATRLPQFPDVPALAESALLPKFNYAFWTGLLVHRDTPDAIVRRLNSALMQVMQDQGFRKFVEDSGSQMSAQSTAEQATAFYMSDIGRYRSLAQAIKLTAE